MPNPSDIAKVLLNSQDIIDQAVNVVSATTKTQAVLEKNILITDKKIGIHNVDEEAHDDIREQLAAMSRTMLAEPDVEGPNYIETGTEGTWKFTAAALISSVKVTGYEVIDAAGKKYPITADAHGVGIFTHTFEGQRNEETYFTVTAQGSYSSQSPATRFDFTITHHLPPDLSGINVSQPSVVSYGKTYDLTISGFQDLDDDFTDYSISSNQSKVTLSKTEGIGDGETIKFTVANDLKGGTLIFTIVAHDAWGLSSTKALASIRINKDPEIVSFTHTYPNNLTQGKAIKARVSGVVDPDGDTVTYDISSSLSGITFSKTTGIALNEDITVTTASSAAIGAAYTLTLTFKDPYGGKVVKTISSVINTPPDMSKFKCTQDAYHVPGRTTKMTFTGATDKDNEVITYSINNTNTNITFSKTSGIAEGEEISITCSSASVRGQTYSFTVTATDVSGASSTATVQVVINKIIAAADITLNNIPIIKPGTDYSWSIQPATDADGHTLDYTVTANNANFVLTNAKNIKAGTNFTARANLNGTALKRGDTVVLTITANDGCENVTKTVNVKINQLPDSTNLKQTGIPADFKGGTENQVTFKVGGATDADNHAITYKITNISSGLTLSATDNLTDSTNITLNATKVSATATKSFTVTPYDSMGEAGTAVVINVTVNAIIVTKAPTISNPKNQSDPMIMPHYEGWTMTWSAYEELVDTDMTHTTYPWNNDVAWTTSTP